VAGLKEPELQGWMGASCLGWVTAGMALSAGQSGRAGSGSSGWGGADESRMVCARGRGGDRVIECDVGGRGCAGA